MAELRFPRFTKEFGNSIKKIPYVLGADGTYLEGFNYYLQDRLNNLINLDLRDNVIIDEPSDAQVAAVSHRILDVANWIECGEAHPTLGALKYDAVRPWHLRYLYSKAMLTGYWSQEFWASGNPTPLSPVKTIVPRIKEAVACYQHMSRLGIMEPWQDDGAEIEDWARAWSAAELAFLNAIPPDLRKYPAEQVFSKRRSPGRLAPPTPEELTVFFQCFTSEVAFRAARLIFVTGLRIEEVTTQTLVDGTYHQRTPEELTFRSPSYPRRRYLLKHDHRADGSIGVMPSMEVAFEGKLEDCHYRVFGKGNKIRDIEVPQSEMRDLWRFRLRTAPLDHFGPSAFLLDRNGSRLEQSQLSLAIKNASRLASSKLGRQLHLTAHGLRHAFACRFMETAILGQAKRAGLNLSALTPDQIDNYGRGPLIVLQDLLGHEWIETTEIYLQQLKGGLLRFQYTQMFNEQLDKADYTYEH